MTLCLEAYMTFVSLHHTDAPSSQTWQAYETPTGGKTANEIDLEEVVKKNRPLGRFMPDGSWDDEDPEGRARLARRQFLRIAMVASFTIAAYLFMQIILLGVEAREFDSENAHCDNLENES